MNMTLIDQQHACRLVFGGSLTIEFARELEDRIIDALRRYSDFEIDLSGVQEIDVCGIHLLGVLDAVGGSHVTVVDSSPAVQRAYERLAPRRGTWLRGSQEERVLCGA
ncbi:MAG TPA: STAS domain-containing protein [Rhodocyclaceae bacterium]|nr:STAS domain-containing protein [Rhodocyclaceae bacterium]